MENQFKGITLAGNILADVVKSIDVYPKIGMLSSISKISKAVGGCVPNTAIDIAKIDPSLPLSVIGKVGDDDYGKFVLSQMQSYNIDTSRVLTCPDAPTSFSDVMSMPSGERTFFHARGANAKFGPDDIDVSSLDCKMFHIGYILLLDIFDMEDPEYGTVMARFLKSVQERGIKTSVDCVSESSGNYPKKIKPVLKYCDYIIFNEIECCNIWGIEPEDENGNLLIENIKKAMELTLNEGVKEKVIVHCKRAGFGLDKSGRFTTVPSLKIPKEDIKGSVGAGDAFCAASLYSIYNDFDDEKILRFASAAAACNLFAENSIDGMKSYDEILEVEDKYGRL